jgi:hypothetical protein
MVVREEKLDGFEACLGRGGEALREGDFVEHHGQVGSKFGHHFSFGSELEAEGRLELGDLDFV